MIIEPLKQEILPKKSIAEDTKVEKDPIKKEILPKKPIVEDTKVEKDPIKKEILSKKPKDYDYSYYCNSSNSPINFTHK